ncbi:MAG: 3-dehydroquinate synthase [Fibrobacteres bacterium]|nr:3-dehydroquinate synthase [Fibrobacterota bacterium]
MRKHVWFTGFMATGKSRIGALVAERLGVPFEDIDHWIEARHRKSVSEIFSEQGEAAFREIEIEALRHLSADPPRVIALGGGSLLHPDALPLVRASGTLVGLWAKPETISHRVGKKETRPLLAGLDPHARLEKIRAMMASRAHLYSQADFQLESSDEVSREEIALQVVSLLGPWGSKVLSVPLGRRSYPIFAGDGIAHHLPELTRSIGLSGRPVVVTDRNVLAARSEEIATWRKSWGDDLLVHVFEPGEAHKTLSDLDGLFTFLLEHKVDRNAFLVAFSGGVGGDMTGFGAACYQRGIDFVQVPTTLLAMVDSSVGGKTAVDHPLGKNMIGAFHQPRLVLADSRCLETLPRREFISGLSEVVKYGVILDSDFFAWLEANAPSILERSPESLRHLVAVSCACKAAVVGQDEREDGIRAILNLGHTFGHALESLTGYEALLHGEAISLGMVCAGRLARLRGLWSETDEIRQKSLLEALQLPVSLPSGLKLDRGQAWEAMARDKKARGGLARFVLPTGIGRAKLIAGVPSEQADLAWEAIGA